MSIEELKKSEMMGHLVDALEADTDIGHYGRLVVAMVGHHFADPEELAALLARNPGFGRDEADALVAQVTTRKYNPPRRERILEWQSRQDFPICPNPEDPRACNVYRELQFPEDVYEEIEDFYEELSSNREHTAA
jgi:hypothetical protein